MINKLSQMMLENYLIILLLSFSTTNAIQVDEVCKNHPRLPNAYTVEINATAIRFWCEKSYFLRGNWISSCVNGEWDTTGRRCEKFVDVPERWAKCGYPGFPANGGRYIDNYERNLRYYCDKTLILVGNEERKCQSNGMWDQPIPKCVQNLAKNKMAKNQNVPLVKELSTENDSRFCVPQNNDTGTYEYLDLGEETHFNAIKVDYNNSDSISAYFCVTNRTHHSHLKQVYKILDHNRPQIHSFILPEVARFLVVRFLQKVSIREIIVYNLEEKTKCGHPDVPFNGKILKNDQNLTVVYECDSGCTMIGTGLAHCVNGVWEPQLPVCLDISSIEQENFAMIKYISIGVGVAGAIVILVLTICLVYKHRGHKDKTNQMTSNGFTNQIISYKKQKYENDESIDSNRLYENINNISNSSSMNYLLTSESGEYVYANNNF